MNTHSNFYKPNAKLPLGKEMRLLTNDSQPRVKTSGSPNRMPLIKEYGQTGNAALANNFATTRQSQNLHLVSNYNIQNLNIMDNDKLKEELIKYKNELNKKSKECHSLKIAFLKLDTENKKNIKIIEEVLQEASKQKGEEEEGDWKNLIASTNMNINTINKLKEAHIINTLRRQIQEYKNLLNYKEEELEILKNSSKVAKFSELDSKFKITMEEMNGLMERFTSLRANFNDKEIKLKETIDERDYYKAMMMRIKAQYDESKEKLQYYTDQNSKLSDQIKILEDKQAQSRFHLNSLKSQIREKDSTILSLEEKLKSNDSFLNEKEKMEKSISNLNKNLQSSKEENEKKSKKIKEIEKQNSEFKEKIEVLNSEIIKRNPNSGGSVQTSHKEKDKKIKKLEDELTPIRLENSKLKEELEKMKNENFKSSSEIERKFDEVNQLQIQNKNLQDKYEEIQISFNKLQDTLNELNSKAMNESKTKNEKIEKVEKKFDNQPQPNHEDKKKEKSDQIESNKSIDRLEQKSIVQPVQSKEIEYSLKKENSNSKMEHTENKNLELVQASETDKHTNENYLQSDMEGNADYKQPETQQDDENYENNFDKEEFNSPEENHDAQEEHIDL